MTLNRVPENFVNGLTELKADVAQQEVNVLFKKDGLYTKVNYPTTVQSHLLPINIYNNAGKFRTDFNPRTLKPARTNRYYVNNISGNDTNNGLTVDTAFKTLSKALGMTGDNEIILSNGVYYYNDGWKGIDPARGISVICEKGRAVFSNSAYPRNWVEDASYPGLYNAPSVYNGESLQVVSADLRFMVKGYNSKTGFGSQLTSKSPTELQNGTVGFSVGTTNTMIRLPFNLNPNIFLDIKYAKDNVVCNVSNLTDAIIYLENIEAHYSLTSPMIIQTSTNNSKVILINIKSLHSRLTDGIELSCNGLAVLFGCEASEHYGDGFNYYVNTPVSGSGKFDIVEIECQGHGNGRDTSGANNGSTGHATCNIIRLNCNYDGNQNRNVHDVGNGWSFNVGVRSRFSQTDMEDFSSGLEGEGAFHKMWLVGCDAGKVSAQTGATLYKETGSLYDSETGTGTITEFAPY